MNIRKVRLFLGAVALGFLGTASAIAQDDEDTPMTKEMKEISTNLKNHMPEGPEKEVALADSRRLMGLTYAALCELEIAYLKKDDKLIAELAQSWKDLKKEGHKSYTDD